LLFRHRKSSIPQGEKPARLWRIGGEPTFMSIRDGWSKEGATLSMPVSDQRQKTSSSPSSFFPKTPKTPPPRPSLTRRVDFDFPCDG